MRFMISLALGWLAEALVIMGVGGSAICQTPSQVVGQDKQTTDKGIDAVTAAAYQKLGAIYGGWPENQNGIQGGEKHAEAGPPGFRFLSGKFPKTKLPYVSVPFCLDLAKSGVTDADLKQITGLSNLIKLELSETYITDKGLTDVGRLRGLRELYLYRTNVTDAGLKAFAALENLTVLGLSHTGVSDAGLKDIAKLTSLKSLGLFGTQVTDVGLRELGPCKNLTTIGVGRTLTDKSLQALQQIGLLHAYGGAIGKDWARPSSAEEVTYLDLHECKVTNASLNDLKAFKNLTTLDLGFTLVSGGLEQLPDFSGLTALHLSGTMMTENISALARFKDLNSLYLKQTKISDAALKELVQLKSLRNLDLSGTPLSPEGVKELAAL